MPNISVTDTSKLKGTCCNTLSLSRTHRLACSSTAVACALWVSSTPFGFPVEPKCNTSPWCHHCSIHFSLLLSLRHLHILTLPHTCSHISFIVVEERRQQRATSSAPAKPVLISPWKQKKNAVLKLVVASEGDNFMWRIRPSS